MYTSRLVWVCQTLTRGRVKLVWVTGHVGIEETRSRINGKEGHREDIGRPIGVTQEHVKACIG